MIRLRAPDYRFIAICVLLLGGTTWFSTHNFRSAFPEASIDFQVSRDQARDQAFAMLSAQGYALAGYRQAARFSFDDEAKTFLEREIGLDQATRIMGTDVRLWRWSYRWFRPEQKEEFRVEITPRGEFAGFAHQIAEDARRPDLTAAQARALAEDFLRARLHRDPAALDFVEDSTVRRPARTDRVFTWKQRGFEIKEATYRFQVTLLGNEVGGYAEYLKVPEPWTRDYELLRSKNEITQLVDGAIMFALIAALIGTIVVQARRNNVRWKWALGFGAAGAILSFLANANQFPLREFGYPTTDSYGSFAARQLIQGLVTAVGVGGALFILTSGAEPLYRGTTRGSLSLGSLFRLRALRTKSFFMGSVLGVALTGAFFAYQIVFYRVANHFGAWAPADVPYDDLLNTRFPWLFVLFGGFFPAVSEEFLFRMFAIPFLRKLLRSTAAAVILAGFVWGFGHAGYPNQPFYIRGVEVGIGGVALGLIMLRWGILPTLIWHYSIDAMYSALLLLRSPNPYFRLSGAASAGILVLPALIALIAYWRRGGFEPETGLTNADAAEPPAPPLLAAADHATPLDYSPLGSGRRWAAAAILAAGALTLLIPVSNFGHQPAYRLDAAQARAAADAFLRQQGLDPDKFRHATYPATDSGNADSLAAKYFLEREPVAAVAARFGRYDPLRQWTTRYFRPLDREEIQVDVHPETGRVQGFGHTLPEERPGADLPPEDARRIGAAFAAAQGWDVSGLDLKESTSEKKKARRDHDLIWEARPGDPRNLDEARYRIDVEVAGDRPASLGEYWKVPETYERSRAKKNALSIVTQVLHIGFGAAGVIGLVWFVIRNIRRGMVPWRPTLWIAGVIAVVGAAASFLSPDLIFRSYNTATPFTSFQASIGTIAFVGAVAGFLSASATVALIGSCFPDSLRAFRDPNRRLLGGDAAAALLAGAGLALAAGRLAAVLRDHFHAQALFGIGSPTLLASLFPAGSALAASLGATVTPLALLALAVVFLRLVRRPWAIGLLGLAAIAAQVPSDVRTAGEFAVEFSLAGLSFACLAVFCLGFARKNYLAYAAGAWLLALRGPFSTLIDNPNPGTRIQAWILGGVAAAVLAWLLRGRGSRVGTGVPPVRSE